MNPLDLFSDYTLRIVALGSAILGGVSGALGSLAVLRKQSLLGDAISHAALPGIVTGILLALARISGETAPLLFTAFGNQYWTADVTGPMASVPVAMYQFAGSPYDNWQQIAWAGALVLTLFVLLTSLVARAVVARKRVPND